MNLVHIITKLKHKTNQSQKLSTLKMLCQLVQVTWFVHKMRLWGCFTKSEEQTPALDTVSNPAKNKRQSPFTGIKFTSSQCSDTEATKTKRSTSPNCLCHRYGRFNMGITRKHPSCSHHWQALEGARLLAEITYLTPALREATIGPVMSIWLWLCHLGIQSMAEGMDPFTRITTPKERKSQTMPELQNNQPD